MSLSPAQNQDKQKTITRPFSLEGIGLHSGTPSKITVKRGAAGTGVTFAKNGRLIKADVNNVEQTERGTVLGGIAVVEHFLAAAAGLGIDNLLVEIEGKELPALDGSALPYVKAFEAAGTVEQAAPKNYQLIERPFLVVDGDSRLEALPFHGFKIDFVIIFKGLGEQKCSFVLDRRSFIESIAPARTFGYISELDYLQAKGLGKGASTDNALVLNESGYVNPPRFADEPVRHKILDLIGDLALLGRPLKGYFKAYKSGHKLNAQLVRAILAAY
ncbi:MAG: UDP-3-O-acyl-N-acetylglucosamine deacetylase [Candidatus Margulisiibacteriota bacterium]|jgi:UDP-3-O-acyl N-acetylglucosamine deacetylase